MIFLNYIQKINSDPNSDLECFRVYSGYTFRVQLNLRPKQLFLSKKYISQNLVIDCRLKSSFRITYATNKFSVGLVGNLVLFIYIYIILFLYINILYIYYIHIYLNEWHITDNEPHLISTFHTQQSHLCVNQYQPE